MALTSACEFPPHKHAVGHITQDIKGLPDDFKGWVCDYELVARHSLTAPVPDYPLYRGLFPSWDNSARKRNQALIFHNADPAKYEYWLRGLVSYTRQNLVGDQRIIFINAWNEWAEGAHLEPDLKYGSAYLEATQRALSGQTEPKQLFTLLSEQIRQINNPDLRERIEGYAEELHLQLKNLGRTVEYFTRERQMVERLRQEREASIFYRSSLEELFGAEPTGDIECWFDRINGRSMRSDVVIDVRTTLHLEGWMLSPGIFPEAETTGRYILLRNVASEEVYATQVYQYWPRQDGLRPASHRQHLHAELRLWLAVFAIQGAARRLPARLRHEERRQVGVCVVGLPGAAAEHRPPPRRRTRAQPQAALGRTPRRVTSPLASA